MVQVERLTLPHEPGTARVHPGIWALGAISVRQELGAYTLVLSAQASGRGAGPGVGHQSPLASESAARSIAASMRWAIASRFGTIVLAKWPHGRWLIWVPRWPNTG